MKLIVSFFSIFLVLLSSCWQNSSGNKKEDKPADSSSTNATTVILSKDTTIKFLWLEDDEQGTPLITINNEYCKKISNAEKAALGYVATFIGSECQWDGQANDDRSNLACKILTALKLGYQCSDDHLGFLRQWFKNDKPTFKELQNCPTTPFTASVQTTFDEISLTTKRNQIIIKFKALGVNMREDKSWNWTETNVFDVYADNIKLVKKERIDIDK